MKLHNNTLFYAGLLSLLLSGCSLFGDDDEVKESPLPKVTNQFIIKENWSTSVGDGDDGYYSLLQPVRVNNMIVAADRYGSVVALNENSGNKIWSTNLAEKSGFLSSSSALLSGGLSASDKNIYVGSEKAIVYALSATDGKLVWKTTVAGEVVSQPAIGQGHVIVYTTNGFLQALDQTDGTLKWTMNLDTPALSIRGQSTPVIERDAVFVGSDSGRLNAILIETGNPIWQQRITLPTGVTEIERLGDVDTTPVIVGETIYTVGYNGELMALSIHTGEIKWKHTISAVSNIIVDAGQIFLIDQDDKIMALKTEDGSTGWSQTELLHRRLTSPVIYRNYLVVGDADGYLHFLDKKTGKFVAQHQVDKSGLQSAPQSLNNQLIVQARNGKVYSFSF